MGKQAERDRDELLVILQDLICNAVEAVSAYRRGGSAVPAIDALRYATERAADAYARITMHRKP
jgi:hypothetical protein